jgi:peptidoglycan hydrolase-like protein with peptidoglycan-binding domain
VRVVREALATTRPAPEQHASAATPVARGPAAILALQRSIGNAAVVALLQREPVAEAKPAQPDLDPAPGWRAEVELLQQKLNWHRGSARVQLLAIDGKFGAKTKAAVVAFKRARKITPHTVTVDAATWEALARPPVSGKARAGKAGPDYDRMFEDGLLEITIARGFDEHGNAGPETEQIIQGLKDVRGFEENAEKAAALRKAAGRPKSTARGIWFVKENVGTSADRPVHAVVRVITPETEAVADGSKARAAALEAMDQGDVFEYGGHARYGTGPDFDRNYRFTVDWDKHPGSGKSGTEEFTDSELLQEALKIYGSIKQRIAKFEKLRAAGVITFHAVSTGNIGINPKPMSHTGDFGAHLMGLAAAGQERPLESSVTESRYRVWLFNGCSTKDYVKAIRSSGKTNANLAAGNLGLHVTDEAIPSGESAEALLTYLDGIMARESAAALEERLEGAVSVDPYSSEGFSAAKP